MDKISLIETFDNPAISLVEDSPCSEAVGSSRVDGKYIIGMIEGQFFKPDGMSRNGRWYPRSLWEKALNSADVKNRFSTSTMFGEIGHSDGPVEDKTLRQGCASHFIDLLWIDEKGRGMGRAYILNTPTGQLLKTYLGAGCKLKVSTRGEGNYKDGCSHDGCPVVDDDSYELQTADFVLNPGFIETSAVLKEEYIKTRQEYSSEQQKQIQETIAHVKREGEKRMTLDIDAYVAELKDKNAKYEAKIESLTEELQAKDKELLQKQFNESAEVKKLNEQLKPFKSMKVSAKTLNETLKKAQENLKKEKESKVKISEELQAYKDKCGSLADIDEATKLSTKALKEIEEYRKYGTPQEFKEAKEGLFKAMRMINRLNETVEKAEKTLPLLREAKELEKTALKACNKLRAYKEFGTPEQFGESIKSLKRAAEILPLLNEIAIKAEKALPKMHEAKKLRETATKLAMKRAAAKKVVSETKTEKTQVKSVKNEALAFSKKYNCTVESAAKLIRKEGVEKAAKLIESVTKKVQPKKVDKLQEGKKLVEEVAQLDKVTNIPAEKTAKDFLVAGMISNYFDHAALGKEVIYTGIDSINKKGDDIKDLLKKYSGEFEAEKVPVSIEKELTPEQAEAEVKKLLK